MTAKIPHNALVVVADGTGARFFRNAGHESKISLSAEGEFKPSIFSMTALQESAHQSHQTRRLTRPHSPNSWQKSYIAAPTAETSRRWS